MPQVVAIEAKPQLRAHLLPQLVISNGNPMRIARLHILNGKHHTIYRFSEIRKKSVAVILQIVIQPGIYLVLYTNGGIIGPDDEIQPPMPRGIFSQNICLGGLILLRSNQMQKCVGQKATETMRIGTLSKISQNVAQHIFIPTAMHDIKK